MKIKLYTSDDDIRSMEKVVDRTRDSTPQVKVDRKALSNLLMDHHEMYTRLQEIGDAPIIPGRTLSAGRLAPLPSASQGDPVRSTQHRIAPRVRMIKPKEKKHIARKVG